ncbi:CRISPR-associated helicase Cas3' [Embleya sp. AB8]|uniref:CRISPR-associated helicase Cas3' n=1 Tax=Embleya sp. AB8 TaxID=3156304 RepID=UPI003C76091B
MIDSHEPNSRAYAYCWGKTDLHGVSAQCGGPAWNPLLAHLFDVGATAGQLYVRFLSPAAQHRLADAFGAGREAEAARVIAFFVALHDLGKASPAFVRNFVPGRFTPARVQEEYPRWQEAARAAGLPLPEPGTGLPLPLVVRHEHITAALLPRLCGCDCPDFTDGERCRERRHKGLNNVALCLAQHHGHFPNLDAVARAVGGAGGGEWRSVQNDLVSAVAAATGVERGRLADLVTPARPSALVTFAGLVILSDWIGSDESRFPYGSVTDGEATWWAASRKNAEEALTALRLDRWQPTTDATWEQLWPGTTPRPFQADAMRLMPERGPALVIVESDTGSGKTRLGLWCAHYLTVRNGYQGVYLAMPTRAATNQAALEVREFMRTALDAEAANLAVVHSTASATDLVHGLIDARRPPEGGGGGEGGSGGGGGPIEGLLAGVDATYGDCAGQEKPTSASPSPSPSASASASAPSADRGQAVLDPWYLRRCLGLLAPFGIGTIDQIVLAVQRSRHWTLRMLGLSGKTVIIDEAHAYELYQQELLGAAIEWLADAGASVVILSATLPSSVRTALSVAWCRGLQVAATDTGTTGPITVIDGKGLVRRGGPPPDEAPALHTTIRLEPEGEPAALAAQLLTEARDGGCVGVIRTRVASALALYKEARAQARSYGWQPNEVILLHSRFTPRDRQPVDDRLADVLGPGSKEDNRRATHSPNPKRPQRLLVIATDVIGQSLDIDFDHILCDLAPIDLLIQFRGRVHRHAVNNAARAARYTRPALTVLYRPNPENPDLPEVEPPPPDSAIGNPDGFVYAPYPLAATFRTLHSRTDKGGLIQITTPHDSKSLLESVYGEKQTSNNAAEATLLNRTWQSWQSTLHNEQLAADSHAIHPYHPHRGSPISAMDLASGRHHGDGNGTGGVEGIKAISRLSEPSFPVVILYQQNDDTLTYDAAGTSPADLRSYNTSPQQLPARRAQERDLLLNTINVPGSWLQGKHALPPLQNWSDLDAPPLRRTHVLLLAPSGHCISGPVGQIHYSRETGLQRL